MDNVSLFKRLAQAADSKAGEAFDTFMHTVGPNRLHGRAFIS